MTHLKIDIYIYIYIRRGGSFAVKMIDRKCGCISDVCKSLNRVWSDQGRYENCFESIYTWPRMIIVPVGNRELPQNRNHLPKWVDNRVIPIYRISIALILLVNALLVCLRICILMLIVARSVQTSWQITSLLQNFDDYSVAW